MIQFGKFKIRPEIDTLMYWFHLIIIVAIVLGALQIWKGGEMFTTYNVVVSTLLFGGADIFAHTILKID
jgi:Ca2+/Na+ antiporter